jgi:DUF4097 and DUF4098 domain-containing protein YvlB
MPQARTRPHLTALLAVLLAALLAGSAVAAESTATFERTLPAQDAVEVHTSSGEIRITESDDDLIHIRGVVTARDIFGRDARALAERIAGDPPIDEGDPLLIGDLDRYGLRFSPLRSIVIDFEIALPRGTEVTAAASSGRIEVLGVQAPVRVSASSGDIIVTDALGSVEASASSGGVTLERVRGAVRVETSSGTITLDDIEGPATVGASSGDVNLSGRLGTVAATTSSGSVRVASDASPSGAWTIRTSSGDVILTLPADSGFALSYRTSSGNFDAGDLSYNGSGERNGTDGTVGAGGAEVEIRTSSGDLRLRVR